MKYTMVAGCVALIAAVSSPLAVHANMLTNGGLEVTPAQVQANHALMSKDNLIRLSAVTNSTALKGWKITGSVDVVPKTVWADTQGNDSVDLIGSKGLGSIAQTVTGLTVGKTYALSFDFAVNPGKGEAMLTKWLDLTITSGSVENFYFSGTAGTRTVKHMQYVTRTVDFTARTTSATLKFADIIPATYRKTFPNGKPIVAGALSMGVVLDNIDLEPLNSVISTGTGNIGGTEPTGTGVTGTTQTPEPASLVLLGIGGLMLLRRRR